MMNAYTEVIENETGKGLLVKTEGLTGPVGPVLLKIIERQKNFGRTVEKIILKGIIPCNPGNVRCSG